MVVHAEFSEWIEAAHDSGVVVWFWFVIDVLEGGSIEFLNAATADGQNLSADPRGGRRAQEQGGVGDVVGFAETAERGAKALFTSRVYTLTLQTRLITALHAVRAAGIVARARAELGAMQLRLRVSGTMTDRAAAAVSAMGWAR
jgi:hypothetical protein